LLEHLAPVHDKLSSVLVTTPQIVALTDMGKCLSFTRAVNLPIIGLIENMSGYVCPCCGEISNVFSTGGGEEMCKRDGLAFLGALPVDTQLVDLLDASVEAPSITAEDNIVLPETTLSAPQVQRYQNTASSKLMKDIVDTVIAYLSRRI
jgi:hypothetical protein